MSELIQALASNDILKAKKFFNESMKQIVSETLEKQKVLIAKSIVVEGEEKPEDDESEDDEDENESDDDESEDDKKSKEKEE